MIRAFFAFTDRPDVVREVMQKPGLPLPEPTPVKP